MPMTDPRNINGLVTSGPKVSAGSIILVRCGSLVTISAWNARFESDQGSSLLMVLPSGFRPLAQVRTDWSSSKGYFAVFASGSVWSFRPASAESVVLTYPTVDPWPSALPGTPA